MGIIAAALIFVRDSLSFLRRCREMVVSIVLIGAMLGAIVGGSVADRIGRRATLLWGGALHSWFDPCSLSPECFCADCGALW